MKKVFLMVSLTVCGLLGTAPVFATEEVSTWTCSENKQFKTTGTADLIRINWESKTFDLRRENSLPGSLRYKNTTTGHDLVVLGNKAMLFNIKSGTRLADFCQTADMKTGKLPHLFANSEPFTQN
jgi:hypothetical protein